MGYMIEGVEQEADEEGYLLEANYSDEAPPLIAQAEGLTLTDAHWEVIRFMRERYREDGHTPNFRNMLKGFAESVRQLARWYAEGKLKPHVSQTLPLERAAEAIQLLASRKAKGKVVLTMGA